MDSMDSPATPFLSKPEFALGSIEDQPIEHPPDKEIQQKPSSNFHLQYYTSLTLRILGFILAIWGCIALFLVFLRQFQPFFFAVRLPDVYRPTTLPSRLNTCDCGSSIAEAQSKGCIYDTLATAWLPPYCRDDELTAEFERSGPGINGTWTYWANFEGTIQINKSQIAALADTKGTFWVTQEWHVVHCIFYWMKYVRMKDTGAVMEDRFDGITHVKHCGLMFRDPDDNKFDRRVEVPVKLQSGGPKRN